MSNLPLPSLSGAGGSSRNMSHPLASVAELKFFYSVKKQI